MSGRENMFQVFVVRPYLSLYLRPSVISVVQRGLLVFRGSE